MKVDSDMLLTPNPDEHKSKTLSQIDLIYIGSAP